MSMISFSENHESSLIAFEDGQALASTRDPRAEGLKWAYSLGAIPTKQVVVVGLGTGFHLAALADVDPDVQITVIESRESLVPVFRSQFPELADRVRVIIAQNVNDLVKTDVFEEVIHERAYVLSFRECWGQQENLFSDMFGHLTGRSVESLKYHFAEFGINVKALFLPRNQLLSIHDVSPVIEASSMPETNKQIFRVLGELVK